MIRLLAVVAALATVCITASSAFIRHAQNGVGCADWPACYRAMATAPHGPGPAATVGHAGSDVASPAQRATATTDLPGVRAARALHRASATLVGVVVLFVAVLGWSALAAAGRGVAAAAVVVTAFLAWLGRYTPHDLPLVTLGNLLGGLVLTAALAWVAAALRVKSKATPPPAATAPAARTGPPVAAAAIRRGALAALALLALAAWTGTMIGARHAIDACGAAPCASGVQWVAAAFDPFQALAPVEAGAGRGLHVAHRVVTLAFAVVVGLVAWRLRRVQRGLAVALALLVVAQVLIGAATVQGAQPLVSTTLHNAVAALLALVLGFAAGRATRA
ncbi:MAG: COX15/CtaA family protein [Burkholderiales bacterium]|nr:COX15/CtaA family protein [Burkholderiales bacterium]